MSYRHIVRVAGTDLDGSKKVPFALTKIKGINTRYAEIITKLANIDLNQRVGYISDREAKKLEEIIKAQFDNSDDAIPPYLVNRRKDFKTGANRHIHGSTLMLVNKSDIDKMKRTKSLKGIRHHFGLKVRGQRTKSTGRKGQIVGVHRKKLKQQKKKK